VLCGAFATKTAIPNFTEPPCGSGREVVLYRCPLAHSCKCKCMFKF